MKQIVDDSEYIRSFCTSTESMTFFLWQLVHMSVGGKKAILSNHHLNGE